MPPEVLEALARHRAVVTAILNEVGDAVLAAWVRAWGDIEQALLQAPWPDDPAERMVRLRLARAASAEAILQASQATAGTLTPQVRRLLEEAVAEQAELVSAQLPAAPSLSVGFTRPPGPELDLIVKRTTEQITARAYWLSVESTEAMNRALALGMAAGDNPRAVARAMLRSAEDVFNGGIARARTIASTELIDAHRQAAEASQAANVDVLTGWVWHAQLSERTCPSCLIQHGQLHPLTEPGPLDHPNGRCARVPKTKTWRELGFDLDEPPRPRQETGRAWFRKQPADVQRRILGPQRYDAWKAGDYPMSDWSVKRTAEGWRDSYGVGPVTASAASAVRS